MVSTSIDLVTAITFVNARKMIALSRYRLAQTYYCYGNTVLYYHRSFIVVLTHTWWE